MKPEKIEIERFTSVFQHKGKELRVYYILWFREPKRWLIERKIGNSSRQIWGYRSETAARRDWSKFFSLYVPDVEGYWANYAQEIM